MGGLMAVVNPFQQINASLPPLAPAPQPALGFDPSELSTGAPPQMPQGKRPQVFGPTPQDRQQTMLGGRLENDYQKDLHPWGTPENHPGVWGKIGHALSWATGGPNRRIMEENGLSDRLNALAKLQSETGLQGAQAGNLQSETADRPAKDASEENLQRAQADKIDNPQEKWQPATGWQGPNGEPMEYNETSGVYRPAPGSTGATFNDKAIAPKGMEHVPLLGDDGKPMIGNYHPDTGKYTDTTGKEIANPRPVPPPPNYGQLILPTKTATYLDQATGVPTEFQWNEKSQRYDIPVGQSATGGYGHEAAQAGAVERAGAELIQDLETNKASLGTLGAWVSKYGLNTPIADPKLAGIQAKMASFAALNPAMHGARGLHAMEHFEKLIGGLQQNPDASIAGIRGIMQTARAINPGVDQPEGGGGNRGPQPGTVENGYRFKGGDPAKQENWEQVKK